MLTKIQKQIACDDLIGTFKISPDISDPFADTSPETDEATVESKKVCQCGGEMLCKNDRTAYICCDCGLMEDIVGDEIDPEKSNKNYDVGSSPIRIFNQAGQGSFVCKTSDYSKTQLRDTVRQLQMLFSQGNKFVGTQNIIVETAEMYHQIQQCTIKRGDVRLGILAACLNKVCKKHNIIQKAKEIAGCFGIEQSDLSNGEKILSEYLGNENPKTKNTDLYLLRYFELLGIPHTQTLESGQTRNYMEFAQKLITFTNKFKIAENSIPSSKCAGAIYILCEKCEELSTKMDDIETKCDISRSTFKRFAINVSGVLNDEKKIDIQKKMKHLFNKYYIPLKNAYKSKDKKSK
jgi:transcription initiation factor TFIIIB Brf1 subunit/transcription initiation factor TFIIB